MKKYLSIIAALGLLLVCAAGCGGKGGNANADSDFIDLTKLSSTLVYAEVYNITNSPSDYVDKTIKVRGVYSGQYYEPTQKVYHTVQVADTAACCSQGFEFQWKGEHAYPEDYPEDGAEIEVSGVFGSYEELGNTYYYLAVEDIHVL